MLEATMAMRTWRKNMSLGSKRLDLPLTLTPELHLARMGKTKMVAIIAKGARAISQGRSKLVLASVWAKNQNAG